MYITIVNSYNAFGEIVSKTTLLRESYRENGKVKNRTLANLTHWPEKDVEALKFALKHKERVYSLLADKKNYKIQQGNSVGAVWLINEIADKLGIKKALGNSHNGKLALWQVIARIIAQGSCLSAVRLASNHAACDVLNISESFCEDDLYENLSWLAKNQKKIEKKLFSGNYKDKKPDLFLYDVTSSYLEGKNNYFAKNGYNRDKKTGKMQLVLGLMCDENGDPVTIEVFKGNTIDYQTVKNQISKVTGDYSLQKVTFVGDRGMIKNEQIEALRSAGLHYITAISKPQIRKLINEEVLSMSLFDNDLQEVIHEGTRYILRRNPIRASDIQRSRENNLEKIRKFAEERNEYLREHSRAKVSTAIAKINHKLIKYGFDSYVSVINKERELSLEINEEILQEKSMLDGCYVIKSDLDSSYEKELLHTRYKDLYSVEEAFRCSKTEMLEMRPWYVQTEESTRGRALLILLAYKIVRYLKKLWSSLNMTVSEGIKELTTITTYETVFESRTIRGLVPIPNKLNRKLLSLAGVKLPELIPTLNTKVVSRKKLVRKE